MKTLNLEQLGVQEMGTAEMKEIDGGVIGIDDLIVVGVFLIGVALGFWAVRKTNKQQYNNLIFYIMKKKELDSYSVVELTTKEVLDINGGFAIFAALVLGFFVGALIGAIVNGNDVTQDVNQSQLHKNEYRGVDLDTIN